jgi:hypothetical protein
MEVTAILMMIIILGIIWGGFVFTLLLAHRKEQLKKMKR